MSHEQFLQEVIDSPSKEAVTVNYDKAQLVKLANFLRQHDLKCKIDSYEYCGTEIHRLTVSKP